MEKKQFFCSVIAPRDLGVWLHTWAFLLPVDYGLPGISLQADDLSRKLAFSAGVENFSKA